jgi:RHS repeat-associated protein
LANNQDSINLNKYISATGICSRREAEKLIIEGRVTINGKATQLGNRVVEGDDVKIDGKPLAPKPTTRYIALNKPVGIVCTTDSKERKNIVKYINYPERLFPIGRLDKPSEGLIFLTNDGDIVNKILRAGNNHQKEYHVTVDRLITDDFIKKMANGIPSYSYPWGSQGSVVAIDDFERSTTINLPENLTGFTESETQEQIEELLEKLCYQYKYDDRNRLVEKKIPGKGWESIVYDKLDRPVLTQDAVQKTQQKWNFTKYDNLGRVAYTGIFTSSNTRSQMQSQFDALNDTAEKLYETKVSTGTGFDGTYYTNSNFPDRNLEVLTVNYYDNYTFNKAGAPTNVDPYGVNFTTNLKSLATGSRIKVLDQSPQKWITTVSYYDEKARPIYVYSKNEYLNTIDIVESKLDDFTGKVLRTKSRHKKTGKPDIVSEDFFTYDHMDRLLSHKQTINGSIQELIVNNTYDELGQLMKKDVGNTIVSPLQEIDYTYNVRGWLKKINDPNIGLGKDLFSFELRYNDGGTKLYNGNISQTVWKTANDNTTRHYNYYYDDLNRITRSNYYAWGQNSRFNIGSISYDKNGNIQRLYRRGAIVDNPVISNSSHYSTMDYLMYTYDGNQLTRVKDNGNVNFGFKDGVNKEQEYVYDANGNMTKDDNKGISAISYNHLNLPTTVSKDWNSIQYVYDATGVKLSKKVNSYPSETVTQYAGNYVYKNGDLEFFNTPEGYATPNGLNGFDYIYHYKDHLGNVRLSYTKNPNTSQETVFTDGFESIANWDRSENSFGHSISALDSSKKRSGAYSGRIDDNYPTYGEKYVYSDTWTSITNSNDTFYTVAAWVYVENVADNSAEIYLATRKAGETGYPSGHYVSDRITQKGQWVYVEKSISVPADVRQLNVRIDNNKDGKVWFDDVKIVKGNSAKTTIVEESNYYPFGLKHKGYNNVTNGGNSTAQKKGFQDQMLDDELGLNWNTFKYRNYDPSLARFHNIDPLAEDYYYNSPYAFSENKVIQYNELEGLEATLPMIYAKLAQAKAGLTQFVSGAKETGATSVSNKAKAPTATQKSKVENQRNLDASVDKMTSGLIMSGLPSTSDLPSVREVADGAELGGDIVALSSPAFGPAAPVVATVGVVTSTTGLATNVVLDVSEGKISSAVKRVVVEGVSMGLGSLIKNNKSIDQAVQTFLDVHIFGYKNVVLPIIEKKVSEEKDPE